MSETFEIPTFLLRTPPKEQHMTAANTSTEQPKARKRKTDAYIANVKIAIPLDMTDASTLANAIEAVAKIGSLMPEGSTVTSTAGLGKI